MPKPDDKGKKSKLVHMKKGVTPDVDTDDEALSKGPPEALCGALPAGKGRKDFRVHASWDKVTCEACIALKV